MAHRDFTQVGKYQIVELIGEGAMGVVYRAIDPVLTRPVAIKVMTDSLAREPELRDRFLREAQAAGSLQHPNIITIYDFGEMEGHPYIAMELVEGADLDALLARHELLTLEAKLDIAIDVLAGLAYAHKHGVIHRDIKPGNIRITEEGRAKIMDFGIAHLGSSKLTKTGMMLGTPNYMAPEQVVGDRTTPATDVFSFGAVLFELLTGSKPFQGPTLHNIFFKIVSEETPSIRACLPGLPAALDRIVQKALAKDPKDRYASALDMANDLSAVRASLSGNAHTSTLSLRASMAATSASRRSASRAVSGARVLWGGVGVLGGAALVWLAVAWITHAGAPASSHRGAAVVESAAHGSVAQSTAPQTPAVALASPARPESGTAPADTPSRVASRSPPRNVARMRGAEQVEQHQRTVAPPVAERTVARDTVRVAEHDTSAPVTPATPAASMSQSQPQPRVVEQAPVDAASPPLTTPAATQVVPPPQVAPPTPVPAPTPAANPRADVAAAIASYARAIGSRDVAEVRRVYPGLTTEQRKGFEQFFRSVRSLHVDFVVSDMSVTDTTAQAHVSGAYEFEDGGGKSQRQPVTFVATLKRDGGAWRLLSVQ